MYIFKYFSSLLICKLVFSFIILKFHLNCHVFKKKMRLKFIREEDYEMTATFEKCYEKTHSKKAFQMTF